MSETIRIVMRGVVDCETVRRRYFVGDDGFVVKIINFEVVQNRDRNKE